MLGVTEIKTVPYVPISHPFIERLIGTIRREYLVHSLFWTAIESTESKIADLKLYRWRKHCRGLYQTPIAA